MLQSSNTEKYHEKKKFKKLKIFKIFSQSFFFFYTILQRIYTYALYKSLLGTVAKGKHHVIIGNIVKILIDSVIIVKKKKTSIEIIMCSKPKFHYSTTFILITVAYLARIGDFTILNRLRMNSSLYTPLVTHLLGFRTH